jgi:hypothetical protein
MVRFTVEPWRPWANSKIIQLNVTMHVDQNPRASGFYSIYHTAGGMDSQGKRESKRPGFALTLREWIYNDLNAAGLELNHDLLRDVFMGAVWDKLAEPPTHG